jgi:hypothetical protein
VRVVVVEHPLGGTDVETIKARGVDAAAAAHVLVTGGA